MMQNVVNINVALAGDHSLNLHSVAFLLRQQGDFRVVSISSDVRQLQDSIGLAWREHYPHVVLIDINFELYRAAGMISFLRSSHPDIRIAALGLTKDRAAIDRLGQMGVHGYIMKNSDPSHLEEVLRRLAAGESDAALFVGGAFGGSSEKERGGTGAIGEQALPDVTGAGCRYFRLAMTEASDEDIRRTMKVPESVFSRFVAGVYRQFGVKSRDGLVVALYRSRLMVRDDI